MRHLTPIAVAALSLCMAGAAVAADRYVPNVDGLAGVPSKVLSGADLHKTLRDAPRKRGPRQFAVRVPLAVTAADGAWSEANAEQARWRYRIQSDGARSLSVHMTGLQLPAGAAVYVYDRDLQLVQGPLTANRAHELWTPVVLGDELIVEVLAPKAQAASVRFTIDAAFHGYRDLGEAIRAKRGSCNVDVACPTADSWRPQSRAVTMLTIGGETVCTGQLVNDALADQRPFVLTADHCGLQFEPQDGPTADSSVFYWNYQAASCGAGTGSLALNQSGATLLSRHETSDAALVELDQAPPPAADVYFAALDALGATPNSGAVIHHPAGEEKSIATYVNPAFSTSVEFDDRTVESWIVSYNEGTTEPGSSGAGLLNERGAIVGVLSGGDASCDNPYGIDAYGRLDIAWNGDGTPETSLKAHLDPNDACGALVPALEPSAPTPDSACETVTVDPLIVGVTLTPDEVPTGSESRLSIFIGNPNSTAVSAIGFEFTPPSGVDFVGGYVRDAGCVEGSVEMVGGKLTAADLSVNASQVCVIDVELASAQTGVYTIGLDAGSFTSSAGAPASGDPVSLTVQPNDPALDSFTFSATPTTVEVGQSVTLTWDAPTAESCDAAGAWSGSRNTSGSETYAPDVAGTTVLRLICRTAAGAREREVAIDAISPEPTPTPSPTAAPTPTPLPTATPDAGAGGDYLDEASGGGGAMPLGLILVLGWSWAVPAARRRPH